MVVRMKSQQDLWRKNYQIYSLTIHRQVVIKMSYT